MAGKLTKRENPHEGAARIPVILPTEKGRYLVQEYLEKAVRRERLPLIRNRQPEIKARLCAVSARIEQLEKTSPEAEDLPRLRDLLNEIAKKEKAIYKPTLRATVWEIIKTMGITKPTRPQTRKMVSTLLKGVPIDAKKIGVLAENLERSDEGGAVILTYTDEATHRRRVISIRHPNKEAIYLDPDGNVICVANKWGIKHFHAQTATRVMTDFTTFKSEKKPSREDLERSLEESEVGLRKDVKIVCEQLATQAPRFIEARGKNRVAP